MDVTRSLLIIAICAGCTFLERALPFLIFGSRPVPGWVRDLGGLLPMAIMMTLVIYCLRNVTFTAVGGFLPQLAAGAVVVLLHLWRKNAFLSIFAGTAIYMLLVQLVF